MSNEERALKCEHLATKFDQMAEKDDSRAAEFCRRADQKSREAEEHPQAPELQMRALELRLYVAYWEERAMWARRMASRFRRRGGAADEELIWPLVNVSVGAAPRPVSRPDTS